MTKPYYNHDHIWILRTDQKKPVWGPHSEGVYHNLLTRALELYPTATSILDAGCGAGAMGLMARERGLSYMGVDESAVGIALGQQHFHDLCLRQFDLVAGNPKELDRKFSIIACINVLHCLPDQPDRLRLLRNLRALIEPGGYLALTTMCLPMRATFRQAESPRVFLEAEQIYAEFAEAGWDDLIVREFIPADEVSPITNVMLLAKSTSS
jgi:2-polyprenyl-3-methyl-5-hydroxy-6-metoxy-1,4-benzoquinol methylase